MTSSQWEVVTCLCGCLPFPFLDLVCSFGRFGCSLVWWQFIPMPTKAHQGQCHPCSFTLWGNVLGSPGAPFVGYKCCLLLTPWEECLCPGAPLFCQPRVPFPFLLNLHLESQGNSQFRKRPPGILELSLTREIPVCSEA